MQVTVRDRNGVVSTVVASSLGEIDATKYDLSSHSVRLTRAERKTLKDPDWIDEDEADFIQAMRELRRYGDKGMPIEDFIKQSGFRIDKNRRIVRVKAR